MAFDDCSRDPECSKVPASFGGEIVDIYIGASCQVVSVESWASEVCYVSATEHELSVDRRSK